MDISFELSSNCICDVDKLGEFFELKVNSFEIKKIPYQGRTPTEGIGQKVDIFKEKMF